MDQSIMGTYFDQEVRRRDDKIRSLGVEIDNLQKESDKRKNDLDGINLKIDISKNILDGIDEQISNKNKEFEFGKSKSLESIELKEEELNKQKIDQDDKQKEIIISLADLSQRISHLELSKKGIIDSLKSSNEDLNKKISENIEFIESV